MANNDRPQDSDCLAVRTTLQARAPSLSIGLQASPRMDTACTPTLLALAAVLALVPLASLQAAEPLQISGIYPHLAAFNSDPRAGEPEQECGIGAVVPWAGKLWYLSYTSHALKGSPDKLFAVSPDLSVEVRPESVGGTHAARMIHRESQQLFIGCYAIDAAGKVRVIPRDRLPGRLTALARHLADPANKVLYLTQEGAVYEVEVHSLAVTELFKKPVPGWHYKGAWTAQGRFIIGANGEVPAASPFWTFDYTSAATRQLTEDFAARFYQSDNPPRAPARQGGQTMWQGISEDIGNLAEWDGLRWRVLARRQHLDITGPGGLAGAASDDEPVWALGWDLRSALVKVRDKSGAWTLYRVPKASYSADAVHGSNTEWPRICKVGGGRRLMFLHNGLYEFPANFRSGNAAALRPLASVLITVTDMTEWNRRLVFGQQATSVHALPAQVPGQPNSNLQFLAADAPRWWGPRSGFGGVWVQDAVKANMPSEPMLVAGYDDRCLHLAHAGDQTVAFTIEADAQGDGRWRGLQSVRVPPRGYLPVVLPAGLAAEWVRVQVDRDCTATAYFHFNSTRPTTAEEAGIFAGLADAGATSVSSGIVRQGFPTRNLQFLTREGLYFEVDENLAFHASDASVEVAQLKATHALASEFAEDAASVIITRYDGQRFRLPKGDAAFSHAVACRGVRECVQERYLADFHGTFYEVPRGAKNQPDFQRMKPVATHNRQIADFCTWRGLLVLSGVKAGAANDGHVFGNSDASLWFGAIDDLWKLGKPRGTGGPWHNSVIQAGEPSDPYLMTGYDIKSLRLIHDAKITVEFTVEVDFYADGTWHEYGKFSVEPGKPFTHRFPTGYAAHWVRLKAGQSCKVTASFQYE